MPTEPARNVLPGDLVQDPLGSSRTYGPEPYAHHKRLPEAIEHVREASYRRGVAQALSMAGDFVRRHRELDAATVLDVACDEAMELRMQHMGRKKSTVGWLLEELETRLEKRFKVKRRG